MSSNYIGHDPKDFRQYGPMARSLLAAFQSEDLMNSGGKVGSVMIALQALKKRTGGLTRVLAENAELKVRIEAPGTLAVSFQLRFE